MPNRQAGFTLVEIAIVLVIIGLLLGGVLKGQELINSAKVKNLAQDFRSTATMVYAYQDRFRALPGDDSAVATHVNGGTAANPAGPVFGRIDGNWNSNTATDESFLFWQHVRLASLAARVTEIGSPDYIPRNTEGRPIGITGVPPLTAPATPWPGAFYVCSTGLLGRFVRQLDQTMDDGNSLTGAVRALADDTASQADASNVQPQNDGDRYTVCMAF